MTRALIACAAAHGFLAVAFGAFAAHGADDAAKALLDTGARYEGVHAVAALVAAGLPTRYASAAGWLFVAGAALFAFSLYALAFGAPRMTGAITPVGGVAMLAGWLLLGAGTFRGSGRATGREHA